MALFKTQRGVVVCYLFCACGRKCAAKLKRFLQKTPDAQLAPLDLPPDVLAHNQSAVGFQFIPQINGGDGFYYAKLIKRQG